VLVNFARALCAQKKDSLRTLARCAFVAEALGVAGLFLPAQIPPTSRMGPATIQLNHRYTEAPGPGVEQGTTKQVETNTPFARIETPPLSLAPQWELNFRAEIPVVWTNGVTPENPTGATVSAFGNALTQAWIVHDFDQRWAVALGGQLIARSSTNGVATDAWEQVTGFVVRAMLPEISPGSYFAPQVRYGIDFEGNDDGRMFVAHTLIGQRLVNLLESSLLSKIPAYDYLKQESASALGVAEIGELPVVFVPMEGGWQLGVQTDALSDGLVSIFVPGAPNPHSGSVFFFSTDTVRPAGIKLAAGLNCLRRCGAGASALAASWPAANMRG
jgi:hypothetical protein